MLKTKYHNLFLADDLENCRGSVYGLKLQVSQQGLELERQFQWIQYCKYLVDKKIKKKNQITI